MPVEIAVAPRPTSRRRGFVHMNPSYADLLGRWGLCTADDFLELHGEIIGGHPDRHVARVRLGGPDGFRAYLKREHRVPWKDRLANWCAGFGFVSVSCREAMMLELAQKLRLPGPEWLAAGEDGDGRAFLLLKEVAGAIELRRYAVSLKQRPPQQRRAFVRRLGRLLASIHERGFEFPDLYAKHILVDPATSEITLLDWQRVRQSTRVSWHERCRELAALNASLAEDLVGSSDRFAFLLAYLRHWPGAPSRFSSLCRRIENRTARLLKRSSIREQRLPTLTQSQPLIWLDGEALCATPRCCELRAPHRLERLAYSRLDQAKVGCQIEFVTLPGCGQCEIIRRRSRRRIRSWIDWLRGRRWFAPEIGEAAGLLRRERLGETPSLLAFGQRIRSGGIVDSFLLRTIDERRDG